MTALATAELVPESSTVRITREYLQEEGKPEVLLGENWRLKDLLGLTLMSSSNAGARAVATAAGAFLTDNSATVNPRDLFVNHINKRASELDLDSIRFYNDNGLDLDEENSGGYGNAEDVAKLVDYILKNQPEILEATKFSQMKFVSADNIVHDVKNTNAFVENVPGIIGSKTGFTDLAQGNLAVAFSPGLDGPYVAVVLGSTFDDRFNDMSRLIDATIQKVSQ
jgi:D-alanyl-D-alanine carboxypeptidase